GRALGGRTAALGGRRRRYPRHLRPDARHARGSRGGEEARPRHAPGPHLRAPAARRRPPPPGLRSFPVAISDALYVVEDWISEHYFTSDDPSKTFTARTKALMQEWRTAGEEDPHWRSPRERFTAARNGLVSRLLALQADAAELTASAQAAERRELLGERSVALADELRTILGYTDGPVGEEGPADGDLAVGAAADGDPAADGDRPGRWDVSV